MIKSIVLNNFRMHEFTELNFEDHDQLILIAGKNGVGKSTILEAILYALYGESRNGRRGLDKLVKKGSELEGMSVELVFEAAKSTYRIMRRRDGRSVTAVMYGNDIPLYEGPNAVTEAVVKLLGMDSQGFRLSTIAQQKELDGLASLKPSDKIAAIKRLLKLDALTRAKEEAGAIYRSNKELWRNSLPSDNLKEYKSQLSSVSQEQSINRKHITKSQDYIFILEKKSENLKEHSEIWLNAVATRGNMESQLADIAAKVADVQKQISNLKIPVAPESVIDSESAYKQLKSKQQTLSDSEKILSSFEKRNLLLTEVSELENELRTHPLLDKKTIQKNILKETQNLVEIVDSINEAKTNLNTYRAEEADIYAQKNLNDTRTHELKELSANCFTCGQTVDAKHKEKEISTCAKENTLLTTKLKNLNKASSKLEAELKILEKSKDDCQKLCYTLESDLKDAQDRESKNKNIQVKIDSYNLEIARLPNSAPDVNLHSRQVRESEELFMKAQKNEALQNSVEIAKLRLSNLEASKKSLHTDYESLKTKIAETTLSGDLETKHKDYENAENELELERKVLEHQIVEEAKLNERIIGIEKIITITENTVKKAKEFEDKALVASLASKALQETSFKLSTQIRPKLEGNMSSLLLKMSNGRFTSVRIDEKYDVKIFDNGEYVNLNELSGGELDLVSLALRLSLAQVATSSGGLSFLILDECFGSQDQDRRNSILQSLRGLKDIYKQILIISHVDNMEDHVDKVITVETDSERKYSYVTESI